MQEFAADVLAVCGPLDVGPQFLLNLLGVGEPRRLPKLLAANVCFVDTSELQGSRVDAYNLA